MKIFKGTNRGSVRENNEDALFASQNLFLVADGMGGHIAGEIASSLLVETVKNYLNNRDYIDESTLKDSIILANEAILNNVKENPSYFGMGTTATMVYVEGNIAYYAHIGDSRFYLFRNNALKQVTEDHSYVAALLKKGEITEEEARRHPKKNFILRAVGIEQNIEVDTGKISLSIGDKLFLTTDGIINCIDKEKLEEILSQNDIDPVDTMIKYALNSVAKDNITAIVTIYDR